MPGSRIGVGIVGLSADRGWAAMAHVPALAMLPEYELRGLVASSAQSARAAAIRLGLAFCSDRLDDLLARPDIDLVVVSVRVQEHRRIVEASLGAGKAVLCEWPLARDLAEAEALAAIAQRASQPCFVNLRARNSPASMAVLVSRIYSNAAASASAVLRSSSSALWKACRAASVRSHIFEFEPSGNFAV